MPEDNDTGVETGSPPQASGPSAGVGTEKRSPEVGVERSGVGQVGEGATGSPNKDNWVQAQLRTQQRTFDSRIRKLENLYQEERKRSRQDAPPTSTQRKSDGTFWENPDATLDSRFEAFEKRLIETLSQQSQQRDQLASAQSNRVAANDYLTKLGKFTDADVQEQALIAEETGLLTLLDQNRIRPEEAAKVLYALWCEEHGINPASSNPSSASGFKPSKPMAKSVGGAATGAGAKQFSAEEIHRMKGTPAYSKHRDGVRAHIAQLLGKS